VRGLDRHCGGGHCLREHTEVSGRQFAGHGHAASMEALLCVFCIVQYPPIAYYVSFARDHVHVTKGVDRVRGKSRRPTRTSANINFCFPSLVHRGPRHGASRHVPGPLRGACACGEGICYTCDAEVSSVHACLPPSAFLPNRSPEGPELTGAGSVLERSWKRCSSPRFASHAELQAVFN
jgi:hypothetical protein